MILTDIRQHHLVIFTDIRDLYLVILTDIREHHLVILTDIRVCSEEIRVPPSDTNRY